MKTCSFQGATPRSSIRGLFCEENEPEPTYRMSPCRALFCSCCRPTYTWRAFPRWRVVAFADSPMHRFVNGYTTYLNCPAVSNSRIDDNIHQQNAVFTLDVRHLEYHLRHDVSLWSFRLRRFNRRNTSFGHGLYAQRFYMTLSMLFFLSLSLSLPWR